MKAEALLKKQYDALSRDDELRAKLQIEIVNPYKNMDGVFSTINGSLGYINNNQDIFNLVNDLTKKNQFHVRFLDHSIMLFEYIFNRNGQIIKHRLTYLKDPSTNKTSVLGLRCDFELDSESYHEVLHPKSHITLINSDNRLLVNRLMTIYDFIYICRIFFDNYHFDESYSLLVVGEELRSELEKKHVSIILPSVEN